jgi:hypothetical protein
VSLAGSWSPPDPAFRAGEPATLILQLTAVGLAASQLPPLTLDLPDDLRQYPDQPTVEEGWTGRNTVAEQTLRIAVIPNRAGRFEIPTLRLPWWNVDTDAWEYAELDGLSFEAAPGAAAAQAAAQPAVAAEAAPGAATGSSAAGAAGVWRWVSLVLAIGWALTVLLWWRRGRAAASRSPTDPRPSARAARRRVSEAAAAGDAAAAAQALLAWGATVWPESPPRSLRAVAERCGGEAAPAIGALERVLYGAPGGAWDGEGLARAVDAFRPSADPPRTNPGGLAALYPD